MRNPWAATPVGSGISWSCGKGVSQDCRRLGLEELLCWRLTWWLLAGGLSPSVKVVRKLLHGPQGPWMFFQQGSCLSLEQVIRKQESETDERGSYSAFLWPSLRNDTLSFLPYSHCHFCHILFIRNESLSLACIPGEPDQAPPANRRGIKGFPHTF